MYIYLYVSTCAKIADVGQWVDDDENDSDDKYTSNTRARHSMPHKC